MSDLVGNLIVGFLKAHLWPSGSVVVLGSGIRGRGYKTFFMLSSAETKIYHAHKC